MSEDRNLDAAERALGLDPRGALTPADAAMTAAWDERFAPLAGQLDPVEPPEGLLTRIEAEIAGLEALIEELQALPPEMQEQATPIALMLRGLGKAEARNDEIVYTYLVEQGPNAWPNSFRAARRNRKAVSPAPPPPAAPGASVGPYPGLAGPTRDRRPGCPWTCPRGSRWAKSPPRSCHWGCRSWRSRWK